MLNTEQAKQSLEKLENKEWVSERFSRAGKLPGNLGRSVRLVLKRDDRGREVPWKKRDALDKELRAELLKAGAAERRKIFEALFPEFPGAIEATWQLFDRLPYQGYSQRFEDMFRRPYRAPGHDELLIERRLSWLNSVAEMVGPYRQKLAWFAAWAPHLAQYGAAEELGLLFAGAIEAGGAEGEEIFQILCASARGEHEVGGMGRHVTRALLCASRPDGWEFVQKLLLAAQRQEGLRQSILETIDEAHPQAFRQMLKLVVEENLARFAATVRAANVWFGLQWDSVSAGVINAVIQKALLYLDDSKARAAALGGKDAEQAYYALWAIAFDNATEAIAPAAQLLKHPKVEFRYAGARMLLELGIKRAHLPLHDALEDADLRIACLALAAFHRNYDEILDDAGMDDLADQLMAAIKSGQQEITINASSPKAVKQAPAEAATSAKLFDKLEQLLKRCPPKAESQKPLIWPWAVIKLERSEVAAALSGQLGQRSPTLLIPYLKMMNPYTRADVIRQLAAQKKWDAPTRDTLFALVGDASRSVREEAIKHLAKCALTETEAMQMEGLLTRPAGDLRQGVLTLLINQKDTACLESAKRLLQAKAAPQRQAGLELLRQMTEAKRQPDQCRAMAEEYRAAHPTVADTDRQHLEVIVAQQQQAPATLDDALGLFKPGERTPATPPVARKCLLHSPVAARLLKSLDDLIHENREQQVVLHEESANPRTELLGSVTWGFYSPEVAQKLGKEADQIPLRAVWEDWWQKRGKDLRDPDGLELLRALALAQLLDWSGGENTTKMRKRYPKVVAQILGDEKTLKLKYERLVDQVLDWLAHTHAPAGWPEFALNAMETSFALVPAEELQRIPKESWESQEWRESVFSFWLAVCRKCRNLRPTDWQPLHAIRLFRLLRWQDEPLPVDSLASLGERAGVKGKRPPREHPELPELLTAYKAGGATAADIIEHLIGSGENCWAFGNFTGRTPPKEFKEYPGLKELVDKCRQRVLEVELARGDTPTVATPLAMSLQCVWGIDHLVAALRALGKRSFARGYAYGRRETLEVVMSHLVRSSFPLPEETAEQFAAKINALNPGEERLLELAVYAPQWCAMVEPLLGWPGLVEGVWWIHAHTKDRNWTVDEDVRNVWTAAVASRTPLTGEDLLDGAVDVAWFKRVHEALGAKRWDALYEAAKYASGGTGHTRARLFADAMLGDVTKKELLGRIQPKRQQDAVRALGLLPLAAGGAAEKDLLDRYKVIQEFIRTSRQFGSQRQASEKRAAQIAQENLARTADYPDPLRLQWAMEAKAVGDLADGPLQVVAGDVTVSLGIDPWGEVEMNITRAGESLSDIPAKLKKDPKISALRERRTELKRQASRIRPALEQFMVRGDTVTARELGDLLKHPFLSPMLKNLVLVGDGIMGYPVHDGKVLEDHAGNQEPLKPEEKVRVAHPLDLLPAAKWHQWQKDCFARERIQPFKQVFRELYVPTKTELAEGARTRRYAGHQVQPHQALALLGKRGWIHHPEEGVRKTFHEAGVVAWLEFAEGFFTPAEIDGLTLETVSFTRRSDGKEMLLKDLPPRLFSEAMRDMDLVVSVAHRGGVDPEASASTIEMRATLVANTCSLLKLANVRVKEPQIIIEGKLGQYSVHLGSAVTHRLPGGVLFIVAIHSQHRGRLFLPFADDDPKTAEVLSKVLLLARDEEIKDPNILDQLRS